MKINEKIERISMEKSYELAKGDQGRAIDIYIQHNKRYENFASGNYHAFEMKITLLKQTIIFDFYHSCAISKILEEINNEIKTHGVLTVENGDGAYLFPINQIVAIKVMKKAG